MELELSTCDYEYRLISMKCLSLRVYIYMYMFYIQHARYEVSNAPIVILK